ncbi:2-C-methyl-D-erythritol 4-phosphate cytidylyltransferase [Marinomonas sp. 2405UD68-3]|uniref:2-C-methyl-D-erythritol 4-phosphate cytidylyltransferase n=1 Tax=Marinomonas sp. 2405UD68-3 TaxID=3391835 RepID=UPI0039C8E149
MKNKIWVVVPAAGVGKRMKSVLPKQYLMLGHQTVLDRTLGQLISHEQIAGVALGLGAEDDFWADSIWYEHPKIERYVGGKERSDTVRLGLEFLMYVKQIEDGFVLVHDAARPLVSHSSIDSLLLNDHSSGGLLAIISKDTIKQSCVINEKAVVDKTIDRSFIWQAQTPQKFVMSELIAALDYAESQGVIITDESSAMELAGYQPALIEGDARNFKITLPIDLVIANALLAHNSLEES